MARLLPFVLAYTVLVIWVLSLIVDALVSTYDPHVTIHALIVAVAGWAFGRGVVNRAQAQANGRENQEDGP